MEISTYEASKKYKFSTGYLRYLLSNKTIKGRQIQVTEKN